MIMTCLGNISFPINELDFTLGSTYSFKLSGATVWRHGVVTLSSTGHDRARSMLSFIHADCAAGKQWDVKLHSGLCVKPLFSLEHTEWDLPLALSSVLVEWIKEGAKQV